MAAGGTKATEATRPAGQRGEPSLRPQNAVPAIAAEPTSILLKLSLIDDGERLRSVNPVAVRDLAVSVAEGVLLHPIVVRPKDGRFQLVVGAHRLAAFRQLGRSLIPAVVRDMTDEQARLLEIDENLIRQGLTALERLTFLGERIEVWAARNPEKVVMDAAQPVKRRGRPPKHFAKLAKIDGYAPSLMGFVEETARDTGMSRRTIYRAVQALAALPPAIRDRLHGTWIASNDAALRQLAALGDPAEQTAVIDVLLAGQTRNVAAARAIAAGASPEAATRTPTREIAAEFRKLWGKATPSQRAEALHWLAGQSLPKGWNIVSPGENGDG